MYRLIIVSHILVTDIKEKLIHGKFGSGVTFMRDMLPKIAIGLFIPLAMHEPPPVHCLTLISRL